MSLDNTHNLIMLLSTLLAGGVGVHLVANVLKKLFGLKTSSVIHTMVVALAVVASGIQYVLQIHSQIPPEILGISGPAIYGFSQIIYRYSNYTSAFLGKVRVYNDSLKTVASDAEVNSVTAPADLVAAAAPANEASF